MGEPGQPLPPCPHCRAAHPEDILICPNTHRLLPLEGRMLDGRFRFIRKLGEGGMSTVWMAENVRVRKRVAIKLMHPEFARNPRTLHRFQNEATAAGRIGNPHICDILDFGESPLGPYMVMEMLQGQSFAELLEDQGRIDPALAVLIIREALKGLTAAHAVGIIHRDLKPENVFLHEPETGRMLVKLMDFGISKFTEDPGGGRTGANVVMGTPEYMSPEQAAGAANVDARTDIWAMGVMLYRAIGGVEPFRGKTMAALLLALSTEEHEPLAQHVPNLPPGLIAIIDRCLAKEPQYRFASAEELFIALAPYQQIVAEGERPQAPIRTGKTMAFPLGAMPTSPPPGFIPTTPPAATPSGLGQRGTVDVSAPTGPVPTLPPEVSGVGPIGTRNRGRARPSPSLEQRLPPPRSVDDSPTGSNPGIQQSGAGTWSSELNPNLAGPDQSWSMGQRTFNDEDGRPHRRSGGGRGWVGWVIGLGIIALLGGGVAVAWSLGAFEKRVATTDSDGGDETGVAVGETGGTPDLAGGEAGTTGGETGGAPSTDSADTGASADSGGGDSGGSGGSGGDSGGSGGSGGDSGGSGGSGGDSGGDSGGSGDSGGDGDSKPPPKDPPFEPHALIKSGNLYTTKARGPNGDWNAAKKYCRSLHRKKRHGLKQWRLATVAELQSFRKTEVSKLLYWSSETDGRKSKVMSMMSGKVDNRDVSDPAPRAFCVSRR